MRFQISATGHGLVSKESINMANFTINLILQNGIILDSFAGSGITAHALLALNKEDGGNRKFILIECEDYADALQIYREVSVVS